MKIKFTLLALCLSSCTTSRPHVDIMAGTRCFDNNTEWEQTNVQAAIGAQVNFANKNGIGPEVGFILSDDVSNDDTYVNRSVSYTKSQVDELYLGLRKNWMLNENWQFFVGGGAAATALSTKANLTYADARSDSSTIYSPYAQTGINYLVENGMSVGFMYRRTFWGKDEDIFI